MFKDFLNFIKLFMHCQGSQHLHSIAVTVMMEMNDESTYIDSTKLGGKMGFEEATRIQAG